MDAARCLKRQNAEKVGRAFNSLLARWGPREVRNRGLRPLRPRIPKTATPSCSHPPNLKRP